MADEGKNDKDTKQDKQQTEEKKQEGEWGDTIERSSKY